MRGQRDGIMPSWLPRFNRVVTNRVQGVYAWLLPPFAVIVHRGRRSGRVYRTPVLAFRRGDTIAVVLTYGERVDWVRNLMAAGHGGIERAGRLHRITDPRIVDGTSGEPLPPGVGVAARYVNVLVAKLD